MSEMMLKAGEVTALRKSRPAPRENDLLQRIADATLWRIEEAYDDGAVGLSRVDANSLCVATSYQEAAASTLTTDFILVASGDCICVACRRRFVCAFANGITDDAAERG
ncbi:MAG: hypothetical protein P4M00_14550 [Azospirillaceae bacterium]|nr:hypothetical protein [Azospirillaceae bacterium]